MKTSSRITLFLLTLFLAFTSSVVHAQSKYQSVGGVKLGIEGTSNGHDWDMKSDKGYCSPILN